MPFWKRCSQSLVIVLNNFVLLTNIRSRWLDIGQGLFCEANIQPSWLNKLDRFITWRKGELLLVGTTQGFLSRQDGSILPAQVANQNAGFASSCPLEDSAI